MRTPSKLYVVKEMLFEGSKKEVADFLTAKMEVAASAPGMPQDIFKVIAGKELPYIIAPAKTVVKFGNRQPRTPKAPGETPKARKGKGK